MAESFCQHGLGAELTFHTPPHQPNYNTFLTASGAVSLYLSLHNHLSRVGDLPAQMQAEGFDIPGHIPGSKTTKLYFGQEYETAVIQALGVLMIRANLLDHGLINLWAAITGATVKQSTAQYYATTNMKAKLDTIRALVTSGDFTDILTRKILDTLDNIKGISDTRNSLVHGSWNMRNGKHRVVLLKPNNKDKVNEITATPKMILKLVEDYNTASTFLLANLQAVQREKAKRNTVSTPDSGDPSI